MLQNTGERAASSWVQYLPSLSQWLLLWWFSKARAFCLFWFPFRVCFCVLYGARYISHLYFVSSCLGTYFIPMNRWQRPPRTKMEFTHVYRPCNANTGTSFTFVNFKTCIIIPPSLPPLSLTISLSLSLHFPPFLSLAGNISSCYNCKLSQFRGKKNHQ